MYYVYIGLCSDDSLYTGFTNNLERRFKAHNEGKGAKYTRSRLQLNFCIMNLLLINQVH